VIVVKLSICPVYFLLPKVSVYCRHVFCNLCCANLTSTSLMHHAWVAGWNQFHANVQRWILFVFVWVGFYIKANGLFSPEFGGWSKLNCFFFWLWWTWAPEYCFFSPTWISHSDVSDQHVADNVVSCRALISSEMMAGVKICLLQPTSSSLQPCVADQPTHNFAETIFSSLNPN